jgi:sugar lactone lactonase YvrE
MKSNSQSLWLVNLIMNAEVIVKAENTLGEGPLWHPIHRMLYWVDIEQQMVHGFDPQKKLHARWPVPKRVGTVAPARNGNLVVGLQGEIAELDLATGLVHTLAPLEADLPDNRCNDGKCDGAGRFWVGTMHLDCKPGTGSLYCIDNDLNISKVLGGLTIANGMGWSQDGSRMFFIDSADHAVKAFTFSEKHSSLADEETVLRFDNDDELPDGMCVDSAGHLWIGFWGGGRVGCYDPETGEHLVDVKVPAPHVTSCCFGGADLKTLYITTARQGLTSQQLAEFPLSGSVFSFPTNIPGKGPAFFGRLNTIGNL